MRTKHEYKVILCPRRHAAQFHNPAQVRQIILRTFSPSGEDILKVLVLNQRGAVVLEQYAYKPLRDINDLLKLPERLKSGLRQNKSRVQRPYVVVINSDGELVFERQYEDTDFPVLMGQEIGFESDECDYQPKRVAVAA